MNHHKIRRRWPCKDQKPWVFGSLTNADNKQKDLALCHWAGEGDFNLSVVMSPLWSSLCGVAICSVAWSSTRQASSVFLSISVIFSIRSLFSTFVFSLYFFVSFFVYFAPSLIPFFVTFSLFVTIDLKMRKRERNREENMNDVERNTHTHIDTHLYSPAHRQTGGQTDRDQIIPVAWSMKLASSSVWQH